MSRPIPLFLPAFFPPLETLLTRFLPALLRLFNHVLYSEEWSVQRLQKHAGARLLLQYGEYRIHLKIAADGGLCLTPIHEQQLAPTVTLQLPDNCFLRWCNEGRAGVMAGLHLAGQADVTESLALVARQIKWDVESDLAAVVGDVPAYWALRAAAQARRLAEEAQRRTNLPSPWQLLAQGVVMLRGKRA